MAHTFSGGLLTAVLLASTCLAQDESCSKNLPVCSIYRQNASVPVAPPPPETSSSTWMRCGDCCCEAQYCEMGRCAKPNFSSAVLVLLIPIWVCFLFLLCLIGLCICHFCTRRSRFGPSRWFSDRLTTSLLDEESGYVPVDLTPVELNARTVCHVYDPSKPIDPCIVCCDEYVEGDLLRTLPCMHSFHKSCIDKWLWQPHSAICPVCKLPVRLVDALMRPLDSGAEAADSVLDREAVPVAVMLEAERRRCLADEVPLVPAELPSGTDSNRLLISGERESTRQSRESRRAQRAAQRAAAASAAGPAIASPAVVETVAPSSSASPPAPLSTPRIDVRSSPSTDSHAAVSMHDPTASI